MINYAVLLHVYYIFGRISHDGIIKVADFGLAEDIYTAQYFKLTKDSDEPVKLPIKWMALESIHFGKFSEKTDVVSNDYNNHIYITIVYGLYIIVVIWCPMLGGVYTRKVTLSWNRPKRFSTYVRYRREIGETKKSYLY